MNFSGHVGVAPLACGISTREAGNAIGMPAANEGRVTNAAGPGAGSDFAATRGSRRFDARIAAAGHVEACARPHAYIAAPVPLQGVRP